jgi:hypothetical protein
VSTLRFFVRPRMYCAVCGGATVDSDIDKDMRAITCMQPDCAQFKRPARIVDQSILLFEHPSDLVLDPHGNH